VRKTWTRCRSTNSSRTAARFDDYQTRRLPTATANGDPGANAAANGGFGRRVAARGLRSKLCQLLPTRTSTRWRGFTPRQIRKQAPRPVRTRLQVSVNLAPPLLGGGTDAWGRPRKGAFGAWMWAGVSLLAKMSAARNGIRHLRHRADRHLERDDRRLREGRRAGARCDVPLTLDNAIECIAADLIDGIGR